IGGVFHSTDGGSTWTKIFSPGDSVGVIDLQCLRTATPVLLCAAWQRLGNGLSKKGGAHSAVYRSTDKGRSWGKTTNGLPVSDSLTGRIAIAPSLSNPNVVYAAFETISLFSDYGGIYRSTDAGASWSAVSGFPGNISDYYQGWYDKVLAVNPLDENNVLFGDVDMYYTSDAGATWENISNAPLNTHVDQHAIAYDPVDTSTIFAGNDGGVYKIRFDSAWQFIPIPVTQFYSSAIDTSRAWFAMGGTQDNGLLLYNDTTTTDWVQPRTLSGDIASTAVNPVNSGTMFAEYLYMTSFIPGDGIYQSVNGGISWIMKSTGISSNDYAAAVPPLAYDLRDTNILYTATNRIYRTTDGGDTWDTISPRLTNDTLGSVTALAISANSSVFISGASDGTVWLSTNGGNEWKNVSSPVSGSWITSLAYDNASGAVYAGLANNGTTENPQCLYRSADLGASWQSVSTLASNFPPAAANTIVIDDKNDSILIAGTDIGVYASRDLGTSWEPLGTGLPHSAVAQLNFNRRTRMLRAATHGRDMWQFDLGAWEQSTSVKEPLPENAALDLQAFPNPFTNTLTVSVSPSMNTIDGDIIIEIVDLSGAVQRIYKGSRQNVSFDVSSLPSGIYFVHAYSGACTAARKILLVR
ncbi:MAG TPA: T9SS type A sorting domain-containing protein, partial [Candidatus Kapabacteria bacterium]|nr:T9SS type A sorting domain-containing protein [Candidatus Kapabacteria bacterium]